MSCHFILKSKKKKTCWRFGDPDIYINTVFKCFIFYSCYFVKKYSYIRGNTCKCWLCYIHNHYCYFYTLCDSLVNGMTERARERVSSVLVLIKDIRREACSALNPQALLFLKIDNGACRWALNGTTVIHNAFHDDILLLPHKSVMPVVPSYKTEVCREHVDDGHRGREHSGAAVVGVTDVEYGMGSPGCLSVGVWALKVTTGSRTK